MYLVFAAVAAAQDAPSHIRLDRLPEPPRSFTVGLGGTGVPDLDAIDPAVGVVGRWNFHTRGWVELGVSAGVPIGPTNAQMESELQQSHQLQSYMTERGFDVRNAYTLSHRASWAVSRPIAAGGGSTVEPRMVGGWDYAHYTRPWLAIAEEPSGDVRFERDNETWSYVELNIGALVDIWVLPQAGVSVQVNANAGVGMSGDCGSVAGECHYGDEPWSRTGILVAAYAMTRF